MMDLRAIARALGGEVTGREVLAPGPSHSRKDRSLSVRLSPTARDGFIVYSFAGDVRRECREHVRNRLGLLGDTGPLRPSEARRPALEPRPVDDGRDRALPLWRRRQSIFWASS
jgi:putative DNA primase/helicase